MALFGPVFPVFANCCSLEQHYIARASRQPFLSPNSHQNVQNMADGAALAARLIGNFASAFFLCSGIWGDLLLIRVFLTCAYACLVGVLRVQAWSEFVYPLTLLFASDQHLPSSPTCLPRTTSGPSSACTYTARLPSVFCLTREL